MQGEVMQVKLYSSSVCPKEPKTSMVVLRCFDFECVTKNMVKQARNKAKRQFEETLTLDNNCIFEKIVSCMTVSAVPTWQHVPQPDECSTSHGV